MSEGTLHITDSRTSKEYDIPIHRNSVKAEDITHIIAPADGTDPADRVHKGLRLLDPGFHYTASHESKITWVDGDKGLLLFRGHNFQQLWENDYEDMVHLMVWSSIPTPEQKETLRNELNEVLCTIPDSVAQIVRAFPQDGPAIPMMLAGLAAYTAAVPSILPAYNAGNTFHRNQEMIDMGVTHTCAVYLAVFSLAYCHRKGIKFTQPSREATMYENILIMTGRVDSQGRPDKTLHDTFRHVGAMGADHEITNSTFSLLVTASSLADPISCVISAISSGYGPLHMGACESAYKTMEKLSRVENAAPLLIENVKKGKHRLYGYGHRIYKTVDPRIKLIKGMLKNLDAKSNPALAVALEIDHLASTDEYFVKRNLHANVDLYIVFLGVALGYPADFLPILIILFRLPGYMAHWSEAMNRDIKLFRPAGIYTGPTSPSPNEPEAEKQDLPEKATPEREVKVELEPNVEDKDSYVITLAEVDEDPDTIMRSVTPPSTVTSSYATSASAMSSTTTSTNGSPKTLAPVPDKDLSKLEGIKKEEVRTLDEGIALY